MLSLEKRRRVMGAGRAFASRTSLLSAVEAPPQPIKVCFELRFFMLFDTTYLVLQDSPLVGGLLNKTTDGHGMNRVLLLLKFPVILTSLCKCCRCGLRCSCVARAWVTFQLVNSRDMPSSARKP